MDILHFSDFHFGNPNSTFDLKKLCECLISWKKKNLTTEPIIVISGDVTFKGSAQGFEEAKNFFKKFIDEAEINRSKIVVCPGNHDMVENSFKKFNEFAYSLRRDNLFNFEDFDAIDFYLDGLNFKVFNSVAHYDRTYGLIKSNLYDLKFNTNFSNQGVNYRIAVLHHHLINIYKNDISALRNAYELINYLDNKETNLILHGHQHAEQDYYLGDPPIRVISNRSSNFNQQGYLNSFNHYIICNGELTKKTYVFENSSSSIEVKQIVKG